MNSRKSHLLGGVVLLVSALLALGWSTLSVQAQGVQVQPVQSAPLQDAVPAHDGGDQHADRIASYGVVEIMPESGLTGTWVISGVTYSAVETTEFEPEHGGFAVGVCVKVVTAKEAPTVALKIESESEYKCSGDKHPGDGDHDFEGHLYGPIVSLPEGPTFIGAWVVGSETFTVTADTELNQEKTPFAVGVIVKVEFDEVDGQKTADSVESKFSMDHGDDDHHHHRGHDGRAFGPIDSLPESLIGTWVIAGLPYSVTTDTELRNTDTFTVGANVKVEYFSDTAGTRVATEIKRTGNHGGVNGHDIFKFVGYVSEKPSGFIGTWVIGEEPFVATILTRFDESNGLLTNTSYVEATYVIAGDQRLLLKLESEVPPGAGDTDSVGAIEDKGTFDSAGASDTAPEIWRIGGVNYVVSAATQIVGEDAQLTIGSTAVVNSYLGAGGTPTATSIQAVSLDNQVLLPLLRK